MKELMQIVFKNTETVAGRTNQEILTEVMNRIQQI